MTRHRRTAAAVATAAIAGLLLAGCGQSAGSGALLDSAGSTPSRRPAAGLPAATPGVVRIDGNSGSLTPAEVQRFEATGGSAQVEEAYDGEDDAYKALCDGSIDLVDGSRNISASELADCHAHGLDVVQLSIAADAVVLAIKNETDVGGDCLTTDQVKTLYRAGSPITTWSQFKGGYGDIPVSVYGADPTNNAFSFFGQEVLGSAEPAVTDLRSDYHAYPTDGDTRLQVVGSTKDQRLATLVPQRSRVYDGLHTQLLDQLQIRSDARSALNAAQRQLADDQSAGASQSQIDADRNAVFSAQGKIDGAGPWIRIFRRQATHAKALLTASRQAQARVTATIGHVGYVRFSYYELFEEQLRPFEITESTGRRNCVFPSALTITDGQYPFSRRLLITTTTRALHRDEVRSFLTDYLDHARDAATKARLVAIPQSTVDQEKAWVAGTAKPTLVTTAGTTSGTEPSASAVPKPAS